MKAIIVRAHGGLEALGLEHVPRPQPKPGEVAVSVRACAVNHLDVWVRKGVPGHTFPLPLIPGNDVAGVVEGVGPGVEHVAVGDEVVVSPGISCGHCRACLDGRDHHCRSYAILGEHTDGGYAECVVVPAVNAVPKPSRFSFTEAAALGIPFLTAWHMLIARAQLQPGEVVLVQAAGSGVGSAAIQIAKMLRATVITTASSAAKLARGAELGADHLVNYNEADVAKEVKRITKGAGANVVLEHVGAATWQGSLRSLAWQGRLVTCGATTGGAVALNLHHLFFKSQTVLGSTMGSKGEFLQVLDHAAAGRLRPVVDRTLPLEDVQQAHRLLEEREVFGRIVLEVSP